MGIPPTTAFTDAVLPQRDVLQAGRSRFPLRTLADWLMLAGSILLMAMSSLLMVNGFCSHPDNFSASFPVCVGGQLSIQAWLAIVGVEFSLLGTVVLPQATSAAISKALTRWLATKGAKFDKLLNSQSSAPVWTQVRFGWKKIFLIRATIAAIVTIVSILYKFSFVRVDREDTIVVPANFVRVGLVDAIGECDGGDYDNLPIVSNNLRDILASSNNSCHYFGNASWDNFVPSGLLTLYVGPSLNVTSVPQLLNGSLARCKGAVFNKFTITVGTVSINSSATPEDSPFQDSLRISSGNPSDFIDLSSSPNGTLQVYTSPFLFDKSSETDTIMSIQIQNCWGHFTWNNNGGYQVYEMEEPVDQVCTSQPFELHSWWTSSNGLYTRGMISAYFDRINYTSSGNPNTAGIIGLDARTAIEIILTTLSLEQSYSNSQFESADPSDPSLMALCSAAELEWRDCPVQLAVARGIISGDGTGMTLIGVVLQGVVLFATVSAAAVLLWPQLSLLSEWPAQWLVLAAGIDQSALMDAAGNTMAGHGSVRGEFKVALTSVSDRETSGQASMRLREIS